MADNLWALREQKKLSVATLASRAGLPIGLIMEYESGQRSVDPRHLGRLARALFLEEADIKLRSDPRPGSGALERQARRDEARPPVPAPAPTGFAPKARERPSRLVEPPRPPAPARPSQLAHLADLIERLGRTQAEVETEAGKPLAQLDRLEASKLLGRLQTEFREGKAPNRHRAYLPEAIDQFEFKYLTAAQEAGDTILFTLFDNTQVQGYVIGFGLYSITVRQVDGSETTVNKLALVSYTRLPTDTGRKEPTT